MTKIHDQLKQTIPHTAYQIAQTLTGKDGGTKFNRVKTRWQRWLDGGGLRVLQTLADDLAGLGFELKIVKKGEE